MRITVTNPEPMLLAQTRKARHIAGMSMLSSRIVCLICAIAAGAALGIALASEYWGGLVPCALCLWERVPYRWAIGLSALGFVLPGNSQLRLWMLLLVLLAVMAAAGLAFVHVGVELGYWPSPLPECAARSIDFSSIAERLAAMPARPAKPCDEATYLIPGLPLSMAAMNLLFALAFATGIAIYLRSGKGSKT